jgi:hypothetical protein
MSENGQEQSFDKLDVAGADSETKIRSDKSVAGDFAIELAQPCHWAGLLHGPMLALVR